MGEGVNDHEGNFTTKGVALAKPQSSLDGFGRDGVGARCNIEASKLDAFKFGDGFAMPSRLMLFQVDIVIVFDGCFEKLSNKFSGGQCEWKSGVGSFG